MSNQQLKIVEGGEDSTPQKILPNHLLGMLIFIFTEVMFFSGFISAFVIVKSGAVGGVWPPPGQPRLPVEETAVNTLMLLLSGVFLFVANKRFRNEPSSAKNPLLISICLGSLFVVFQGFEWSALLKQGLTMSSSTHGAFFYLIVGTHAAHCFGAILALAACFHKLIKQKLEPQFFWGIQAFWYFVVLMWPILYVLVYL
mgnify:CR=1 FL=1